MCKPQSLLDMVASSANNLRLKFSKTGRHVQIFFNYGTQVYHIFVFIYSLNKLNLALGTKVTVSQLPLSKAVNILDQEPDLSYVKVTENINQCLQLEIKLTNPDLNQIAQAILSLMKSLNLLMQAE